MNEIKFFFYPSLTFQFCIPKGEKVTPINNTSRERGRAMHNTNRKMK